MTMTRISLLFQFVIFLSFGRKIFGKIPEQIRVERDESFTFDCAEGESVFYAQQLGDWTEVTDENDNSQHLNLQIQHLTSEKLIRVTCSSAQSENIGYYGCRKSHWLSTSMSRVFQLVLSDVESFYWTYVCHGPAGSCDRQDDSIDENRSVFYVADQTKSDIFCCASTSGFSHVEVKMNPIGDGQTHVNEQRRVDLDGSSVVCAKQHPFFSRSSPTTASLTCELIVDQRSYRTYTSRIVIKDAILADPDIDYSFDETTRATGGKDDRFFDTTRRSSRKNNAKRKFSTGKLLAIVLGSTFGGIVLLAVIFSLCICLCHEKKASTSKKNVDEVQKLPPTNTEGEEGYVEATPLYVNAPVFQRL